jgi:hypothetical protein
MQEELQSVFARRLAAMRQRPLPASVNQHSKWELGSDQSMGTLALNCSRSLKTPDWNIAQLGVVTRTGQTHLIFKPSL